MSQLLFKGIMLGMEQIGFVLKDITDTEISFYVPTQAIKEGKINDSIMKRSKETIESMYPLKVIFYIN